MAGKYNKHKQDGSHPGFPARMILATVDLQVTLILPMNFKSIALSVQKHDYIISSYEPLADLFFLYFNIGPNNNKTKINNQKKKKNVARIFL